MTKLTELPAWHTLSQAAEQFSDVHMRDLFAADPQRAERYQLTACDITMDYAKHRINDDILQHLLTLAEESGVSNAIHSMFAGDKINHTEHRAVLHTALRQPADASVLVDGENVVPAVHAVLARMQQLTDQVHSGAWRGYTGKAITDVLAIGIGGSFLGPKIMTEALKPYQTDKLKVHFVANVDGCHIHDVTSQLDAETTLVVMSSKSFSTQETLQNTMTAKAWFLGHGGTQSDIAKHFVAVSTNVQAATEFGIAQENILPMEDWVGGRYSLWSAIGLPICLALGFENFTQLLSGARAMDEHFATTPLANNMPVIQALLGVWYRNFFAAQSYTILPYYHYLRGLPAYVQQLDMESNGKRITHANELANYATGPIVFGSEGTNGQHSFHQLIHQSETLIPVDFIFPLSVPNEHATHHAMLAANCFGQAQALMQGKTFDECYAELSHVTDEQTRRQLATHKVMPGNKPSSMFLLPELNPKTLGSLIALYEHKVFVQGVIWQVNSFDQWGVELGKVLGENVLNGLQGKPADAFDSSTQALINTYRQHKA